MSIFDEELSDLKVQILKMGSLVEEAIANGRDALAATMAALAAEGFAVPAPNSGGVASGKFVARVPKPLVSLSFPT